VTGRVRFGPFEADIESRELWRDGRPISIQDLPFRLLSALIERPGEVVTRSELTTQLWGSETYVDAVAGLNTAVAKLREALGDNSDRPMYVETLPKRGYRFVGRIEPSGNGRVADTEHASASASSRPRIRTIVIACGAVALILAVFAAYRVIENRAPIRIAVMLFDNETGNPAFGQFAQGLTDATVARLTEEPRLAVIGNAAILRSERPFRDIQKVSAALGADYVIVGQVQKLDEDTIVRAHLIRASDQSHLWVGVANFGTTGEGALQTSVSNQIRDAVMSRAAHR
jgi:DNA-binding winged helix-turn-helix (wHTH) protein